jgi:hypothetical protein
MPRYEAVAGVKQRRAGPALLLFLPGSRTKQRRPSPCLSGRLFALPHGSTSSGPGTPSRPDHADPLGPRTTRRDSRGPSTFYSRSLWHRGVPRAPAHEGIRGGRAPSKPSAVPSAAKAFLALTPSSNLHEPTVVPSRVLPRLVTGRNRGRPGRPRPAPLGIIGGAVAQHRPENARQPAGQRDRRHRPPPPRGDPERPRP